MMSARAPARSPCACIIAEALLFAALTWAGIYWLISSALQIAAS